MTNPAEPLASYIAEPSRIRHEISVTGKWVPAEPGGRFQESPESREMLREWEDIHEGARVGTEAHDEEEGLLRFEVYRVLGEDALVIHEVFAANDELKFHLSKAC